VRNDEKLTAFVELEAAGFGVRMPRHGCRVMPQPTVKRHARLKDL
jgi:hypothetical protein